MFAEVILEALEPLAESTKIESREEYVVGRALLAEERFEDAVRRLISKIRGSLPRSEVILCKIREGRVVDMGAESLTVIEGLYAEAYDYDTLTVVFLRIYLLTDGERRWTAVYVDENSRTPWWRREERPRSKT
ncbi:MAG: hypothetical protein ACE5KH_04110 [Candidatus Geothermarchaeales archaeon]